MFLDRGNYDYNSGGDLVENEIFENEQELIDYLDRIMKPDTFGHRRKNSDIEAIYEIGGDIKDRYLKTDAVKMSDI
jgi:hypothetical protein